MTLECTVVLESWPLAEPFEIAREVSTGIDALVVTLRDADGRTGRGEAAGVSYDDETLQSMASQIELVCPLLHADVTGADLQRWLPAGGARNALDCALWDLRAKQTQRPAWAMAGLEQPRPVMTAYTIGLGSEADVRRKVRAARHFPLLKLKADATRHLDMVRWAREEHPEARLVIDANQAWDRALLQRILPALAAQRVELIEQPVPRGTDEQLADLNSPIPLAADESCSDRGSLQRLRGLYQYVNIKLDKSGGLTEALAMVEHAREMGFGLMVGNMGGTSLAMAPAHLVAQACSWVDLDGPLLLREDRGGGVRYDGPMLSTGDAGLWG